MKLQIEPTDIERLKAFVAQRLGLVFEDSKQEMLADALRQRVEALKLRDSRSYVGRLAADREELRMLTQLLTVNETFFFRNSDHFKALTERILPRLNAQGQRREIRILSAGCASGEEPYTLAILMRERGADFPNLTARITAFDLNPAVLQKARQARYSSWALRGTAEDILERHFLVSGREFVLNDNIRSAVAFHERNLVEDDSLFWRAESFDVVFCRNVIMYFPPKVAQAVIRRISRALAPGGYLFLGHAETLRGLSNEFHLCHSDGTFYYQRRDTADLNGESGEHAAPYERVATPAPLPEVNASWVEVIQRASDRIEMLTSSSGGGAQSRDSGSIAAQLVAAEPAAKRRWDLSPALDLMRSEQFTGALEHLSSLPEEARTNPDVLMLHAVLLTNRGELANAEKICAQILAADELNVGAHYVMALCREHAGDLAAAKEHNRVAAYLDATFAMPHLHLGLMARRGADGNTALIEFAAAQNLLGREDASRILLFGGGFSREALMALCQAELNALEATP
jgi:chemotaxis protein methyltransferase CheR